MAASSSVNPEAPSSPHLTAVRPSLRNSLSCFKGAALPEDVARKLQHMREKRVALTRDINKTREEFTKTQRQSWKLGEQLSVVSSGIEDKRLSRAAVNRKLKEAEVLNLAV